MSAAFLAELQRSAEKSAATRSEVLRIHSGSDGGGGGGGACIGSGGGCIGSSGGGIGGSSGGGGGQLAAAHASIRIDLDLAPPVAQLAAACEGGVTSLLRQVRILPKVWTYCFALRPMA